MANAGGREGFNTITPYLIHADFTGLLRFVEQAFGAHETFRSQGAAGGAHIEVRIGDSMLMIGGAGNSSPVPAMLHLYVDDVDAVYQCALQAGATSLMEPAELGDGDRRGGVKDNFGNQWWIATHIGTSREQQA